jgi:hypothetical protein
MTVRVHEVDQTANGFSLITRSDTGAIINPQTNTLRFHIMTVYQRNIVLSNLCTVNGDTLTILGGTPGGNGIVPLLPPGPQSLRPGGGSWIGRRLSMLGLSPFRPRLFGDGFRFHSDRRQG